MLKKEKILIDKGIFEQKKHEKEENNFYIEISDEDLEKVFGGSVIPKGRSTVTRKCPSSILWCC